MKYDALSFAGGIPPFVSDFLNHNPAGDATKSNFYLKNWERDFDYILIYDYPANASLITEMINKYHLQEIAKTKTVSLYKIPSP